MSLRSNYLTVAQNFALEAACATLEKCDWGYGVFMVGSCLTRHDYRDVDLRCILPDDEFAALVCGSKVRKRLLDAAISEWLAARTGLPIDFQFQASSESDKEGGPRNAVGILIESEARTALGGEHD